MDMLALSKIEYRALNKIAMYNPYLIANLSKEAYDLYVIRKEISEYIFSLITIQGMTMDKFKNKMHEEIKKVKNMQKMAESEEEKAFLELKIKELGDYL
jgi:hypothetical protein